METDEIKILLPRVKDRVYMYNFTLASKKLGIFLVSLTLYFTYFTIMNEKEREREINESRVTSSHSLHSFCLMAANIHSIVL